MLGLTGHVLARRLALQTMSDSRPTESLIEEVAADAAAAYEVARSPNSDGGRIDGDSGSAYDLDSDADSMPDLESLSDTDSIMDLIDDATPFPDYMLQDLLLALERNGIRPPTYYVGVLQDVLLSLERNGIHPREYDNAMEYYIGHTYALHLDAAAA